jgi:hypothetical protein
MDADPFLAPVPLALYPTYLAGIAPNQPMDLGTALQRMDASGVPPSVNTKLSYRSSINPTSSLHGAEGSSGLL